MGAQDLPDALGKRERQVQLTEGGTFIVTRWSIAKTIRMASWIANAIKDVPGFDAKSFDGLSPIELGTKMIEVLGDKILDFLGLAVDPAEKATVLELPADDALDVFQAIFELNVTDKLVKKVKELSGLFRSKFQLTNGKST